MVDKTLLKNQKGQAVFEMIIFLPFLVFLYSIYSTAGNSISGSINQQKAVRSYFYAITKGNSYLNTRTDLKQYLNATLETVGFSSLGWREKTNGDGKSAFAPCFKFSSLLKNSSTEECDSPQRDEEGSSRYIRVFTYYGVCGPVYTKSSDPAGVFFDILPQNQNNPNLCSLSSSPPS